MSNQNLKIQEGAEDVISDCIKIAEQLPVWFSREGIKNMNIDLEMNHVVVALDQEKVVGFLCFTSYCGTVQIIWMAVDPAYQRSGIGGMLLEWLEEKTRSMGLKVVQVETLSDEEEYEPYERTRNFYYKNGFKKIYSKKASIEGWDDQIGLEKQLS